MVAKKIIATGFSNETNVPVRKIIDMCIRTGTSNVIISHNHPHGNEKPSGHDDEVMKYLSLYLSLMTAFLLGGGCNKVEPVEEEQLPDNEAAFRASTFVAGMEDVTLTKWEANKDKIGVFASNESGALCEFHNSK